eukprot:6193324-Pleurochrysis_carterae.AAC.4
MYFVALPVALNAARTLLGFTPLIAGKRSRPLCAEELVPHKTYNTAGQRNVVPEELLRCSTITRSSNAETELQYPVSRGAAIPTVLHCSAVRDEIRFSLRLNTSCSKCKAAPPGPALINSAATMGLQRPAPPSSGGCPHLATLGCGLRGNAAFAISARSNSQVLGYTLSKLVL